MVTISASALGAEADVLRAQLERFDRERPDLRVVPRSTPDAADLRRQLYVQWLNAHASDPDVLQLDVIWTPEFAAAGWLLPLERFAPETGDLFPATLAANRWRGALYALPWFVDFGLLYWRTDLIPAPPATWEELVRAATAVRARGGPAHGLVWQGARYEGLVTVFLEHLTAFGGEIVDAEGRIRVDAPPAVEALRAMKHALDTGIVPRDVLTWHEEETRFAFQNGEALFMRNWPYAYALMQDPNSAQVAGRFGVALFPRAARGRPAAALGGAQLAINAHTDVPDAAWALVEFLTQPEQLRERAVRLGHYPPRPSLYRGDALAGALAIPPGRAREILERAVSRPATPIYAELSELLQVQLHRALSGQVAPGAALADAADAMRALLSRAGLGPQDAADRAPATPGEHAD